MFINLWLVFFNEIGWWGGPSTGSGTTRQAQGPRDRLRDHEIGAETTPWDS